MIVVDASALLELLLRTPLGGAVTERVFEPDQTLHAPHLLDIEIAHALRRLARTGHALAGRCILALDDLSNFPITRYSHTILLPRLWELRNNLTAYDAVYVALAELLDAPLLTCDGRIGGAAGHRARVDVI